MEKLLNDFINEKWTNTIQDLGLEAVAKAPLLEKQYVIALWEAEFWKIVYEHAITIKEPCWN
jgi:hypothetical protein